MRSIRIVVADGGRARFVDRVKGSGAYRTVQSFESTHRRDRARDLGRDRPARSHESVGTVRHAVEPKADLKRAEQRSFLGLVAEELRDMVARGECDDVLVVAPARCLAELRSHRSSEVAERIVAELDLDLANTPDHALADLLDAKVPALGRYGAALRTLD